MTLLESTIKSIRPLDAEAMEAARERQDNLTKPLGSLGRLEEISIQLAGIFRQPVPKLGGKAIILAAGDHGVAAEGVSAYPSEVTSQMVLNFLRGGAAINVLGRLAGARVVVVDAGVAVELPASEGLYSRKIAMGTKNMAVGPAMSRNQAIEAVETGILLAQEEVSRGTDIIGTGDMGIGNTTPSSAIVALMTGKDPDLVTGRGTGISDSERERKVSVVRRALEVNRPDAADAIDVLTKVGGFEIGVLAGVMLGTAAASRVVVVDGFISGAAALIAHGLCPRARDYFISAHLSVEPGAKALIEKLDLKPVLNLDMRLGEGTGGALAMHIIEAAAKILAEMATFADAGVSEKNEEN